MDNKGKNFVLIGVIGGMLIFLILLGIFLANQKILIETKNNNSNLPREKLGTQFAYEICDSGDGFGTSSVLGSNSSDNNGGLWLTTGATSTLTCYMKRAVSADLNLYLVGSSTTHRLYWEYAFNKATTSLEGVITRNEGIIGDDSTDDLAVWYVEDTKVILPEGEINHAVSTTTHNWAPGVSTSTRNITIPMVASDWMQIRFSVSGANAALYGEVVKKEPIN